MEIQILVIGAGPAGLMAAKYAAEAGANVLLAERADRLGGQLIKQTHKFFGSKEEYAGERGIDIAAKLIDECEKNSKISIWKNAQVLGIYPDGVVTVSYQGNFCTVKPEKIIIATGAAEKTMAFANNDLPGIYGAGAVQTLMNVHGVLPAKRILMVGAGNIGVIVAYQLLQAGVDVAGVVEAGPAVGGYQVHAAKLQRHGVPIYTSHSVKAAHGSCCLEGVTICRLDKNWQTVAGSEQYIEADGLCLAVGLSPLTELLWQSGCEMKYVPELGGYVPLRDGNLRTTRNDIYVAGDVSGVEEASAAMVEGKIAGLEVAALLGCRKPDVYQALQQARGQLRALRSGPAGVKICNGLRKVVLEEVG
ncbi:sarcosine oxidase subunit alpha [Dendrosporobacter quercicolus]|uniref:Sarcosine oxidase subunit alpha n=1 Tax=Dendrosporobacter quercicolus TaxID=146817 RepID=A0A1G9M735_9FIRM|nr:FAD-dependent oxidoreductase [Dendrosporobacter quercicolus]SDL70090.1 sarcosine oxidase subunit alpha [Dendrosporobacter quercicolus]